MNNLPNIVNFALIVSFTFNAILIWFLVRQNSRTPAISIYAYLVFLLNLDILGILYFLNSNDPQNNLLVGKIRFIIQCISLGVLNYFAHVFTYSRFIPKLTGQNLIFLGITTFFAISPFLPIFAVVDHQTHVQLDPTAIFPWVWMLLILTSIYLVQRTIKRRYKSLINEAAKAQVRVLLSTVLPVAALSFFFAYFVPYMIDLTHASFMIYFFITLLLFYSALHYQIFEFNENNRFLLPQMALVTFLMAFFYLSTFKLDTLRKVFPNIVVFLGAILLGHYIILMFMRRSSNTRLGYYQILDKKIETFSEEIARVMDLQQLWDSVQTFCFSTLKFSRIAIITLKYDVTPYQIAHISGFSEQKISDLLSHNGSPLLEKLEIDHQIINKFDYQNTSEIYRILDEPDIYLGIPLVRQDELLGLIFLGGDHQYTWIRPRHIHLLKVISSQVAIAVENIYSIDNLIQSQKMAGVGMLASQIAHDFQSFITLSKLQNKENQKLVKHASYMEKMVQDLLNYARPQELKLQAVDINRLIDTAIDVVDVPENVTIVRKYEENLPQIKVDTSQLRRVFVNLISNGIRACRLTSDARLVIKTRKQQPLTKVNSSPWVYIEIMDEGVGIPEEFVERIFDPFFTTYKTEGGNGLGLAIVKQILNRHAGFIDVNSERGKGTIFSIRLPHRNGTP